MKKYKTKVVKEGSVWSVQVMAFGISCYSFGPFKNRKHARFVQKDLSLAIESSNELLEQ